MSDNTVGTGGTGADTTAPGVAPMALAAPAPITNPWLVLIGFVICAVFLIVILVLPVAVGPQIYNNDLFRQISVVIVAVIIAFLTFGLLSGSTAGIRMNPVGGLAISLGGAVAGVFAFYYVISDRLTPTTHMVVFVQADGQNLPGEVDLTGDQTTARQVISVKGGRGEFQILARGQPTALQINSDRWKIAGVTPIDCKDLKDGRPFVVKPGCEQITLNATLTGAATTVKLADYTASQTFPPGTSVSLNWAMEKLRTGAADWLHARNNTIPVNLDWNVADDVKNATFTPRSNSTEVSLCVLLADLRDAFNETNPGKRVKITVTKATIKVDPWSEGKSDDDCSP